MKKEKQWVVYGAFGSRIGRLWSDNGSSFDIKYSDGQVYRPESWSKDYVKAFNSILGAAGYLVKNKIKSPLEIKLEIAYDFPKEFKSVEKFYEATKNIR